MVIATVVTGQRGNRQFFLQSEFGILVVKNTLNLWSLLLWSLVNVEIDKE